MISRSTHLRRHLAIGAIVLLTGTVSAPALRDAVTYARAPFAQLDQPFTYLVGAPLFGLWDTLSVITLHQHYAVLWTFVFLYLAWRFRAFARGWRAVSAIPLARRLLRRAGIELLHLAVSLAVLVAFYAAWALMPRPMTRLTLIDEPDLLVVDFHSHTNFSHDGRKSFTATKNRNWHQDAGFDAAYITDHYTWAGADEAYATNDAFAGSGLVMLQGAELRLRGRYVNALGDASRYSFALDSTGHHLDPQLLNQASPHSTPPSTALEFPDAGHPPPTFIYTIPGPLDQVVAFSKYQNAGVVAIEVNDGAPRGLEQIRGQRDLLLAVADSLNLALVSGANLHGWGRTAAAWTVMEVIGWRAMTPAELATAIEATLHAERRNAASVVERRVPYHDGSDLLLAATVPWLLWEHMRMLSWAERSSWLVWILVFALVTNTRQRRRERVASE